MGTNSIKLYNKKLSDQILGMKRSTLTHFLESHLDVLRSKEKADGYTHCGLISEMNNYKYSLIKAIESILKETKLREFKKQVAFDFCYGNEVIYLDYWGCYAEVFAEGKPKGSISCIVTWEKKSAIFSCFNQHT